MVTDYVTDKSIDSSLMPAKTAAKSEDAKPRSVVVPEWWIEALRAAMAARGLKPAGVARILTGVDAGPAFIAMKSRISRFLSGINRSIDTVDLLRGLFGLPAFTGPEPRDLAHARLLERVASNPEFLRRLAILEKFTELASKSDEDVEFAIAEMQERQSHRVKPHDAESDGGGRGVDSARVVAKASRPKR